MTGNESGISVQAKVTLEAVYFGHWNDLMALSMES